MNHRTVLSLDLAKRVIQACKVTGEGEIVFNKALSPDAVKQLLAQSKPCIVAMEGCSGFHYWGRLAQEHGHEVRAMPPIKVKPFVGKQKTDANDAVGIFIACKQPGMTFCPVKNIEQQTLQSMQSSRRMLERSLTGITNHIVALMHEYGIYFSKGKKALRETMSHYLSPQSSSLSEPLKQLIRQLWLYYQSTEDSLKSLTEQLNNRVKHSEPCQRLMALEGVAEIGAAGLYASLGDGSGFKNGRQASAYIGVTPKQHSSGGKVVMVGIDKKGGDKALRANLYLGALAVVTRLPAEAKTSKQQWLIDLVRRVGVKRACIALVNKTVRTAWALLRYGQPYQVVPLTV